MINQLLRYGIVGVMLNAALYGAYLLLTNAGTGSRLAMTLTYASGVLIGFLLNRQITFRYQGRNSGALTRYIVSYVVGYLVNLGVLWVLVDHLGFRHEWVQGGVVVTLPVLLFALQRYWVFPAGSRQFSLRPVQ